MNIWRSRVDTTTIARIEGNRLQARSTSVTRRGPHAQGMWPRCCALRTACTSPARRKRNTKAVKHGRARAGWPTHVPGRFLERTTGSQSCAMCAWSSEEARQRGAQARGCARTGLAGQNSEREGQRRPVARPRAASGPGVPGSTTHTPRTTRTSRCAGLPRAAGPLPTCTRTPLTPTTHHARVLLCACKGLQRCKVWSSSGTEVWPDTTFHEPAPTSLLGPVGPATRGWSL